VNPLLTKDARRICGKPGQFYTVAGGVGKLVMFLCSRHARRLARAGLTVIEATPLEAAAFRAAVEKFSSFCSCSVDPFTCAIEKHQIKARQNELLTLREHEGRRG
jgi:hypothetical protein